MTDNELRILLLKKLYDRRREVEIEITSDNFDFDFPQSEIKRIFKQLFDAGLAEAITSSNKFSGFIFADPKISRRGIDIIEGTVLPLQAAKQKDRNVVENEHFAMDKKIQIFLCHAREDKEKVMEVYRRLEAEGLRPWIDKEDLLPGQVWDREIQRAIKESDFALVFFSKHSVSKRGYYQKELKILIEVLKEMPEGQIFVIPVRLDQCESPDEFKKFQHANLFEVDGFEKVVKSIKGPDRTRPSPYQHSEKIETVKSEKVETVRRYVLDQAEKNNWSRPGLYFTQQQLMEHTGFDSQDAYDSLDELRKIGLVACVNWKAQVVWMATESFKRKEEE